MTECVFELKQMLAGRLKGLTRLLTIVLVSQGLLDDVEVDVSQPMAYEAPMKPYWRGYPTVSRQEQVLILQGHNGGTERRRRYICG